GATFGLGTRAFFRSGLTWRATPSQSARSSSLRCRLRGDAVSSCIQNDGGRFMDDGCAAADGYAAALPEPARSSDAPQAVAPWLRPGRSSRPRWRKRFSGPVAVLSPLMSAETVLRSVPTGAH